MPHAIVLQHVSFEHEGTLRKVLVDAGFTIETLRAGFSDVLAIDPSSPDLLVVLGGPIGVYASEEYPFLKDELAMLASRLATGRPTLGICLGAQLMAASLGGAVYRGTAGEEIGWAAVHPPVAADRPPVLDTLFDANLRVLHWHGDTFDLPPGATHLASSARYRNQAFSVGTYALALQFHPEVQVTELEAWYIGHAAELAQAKVSVSRLRADGRRYAPALERAAPTLWRACLEFLSLL